MSNDCNNLPGGSVVIISEPQIPYCEQCGNDVCVEKIDSSCVIYHINNDSPTQLVNLNLPNLSTLEHILEEIDGFITSGGMSGTSGVNGTSGVDGTSGVNGTSGTSGANGTSGTSGVSGTSGTTGTSGTSGMDGTSGVNGTSGLSGTSGVNGTSGINGVNGTSGTSGTTGTSGVDGTSGVNGTSGTSGVDGTSGLNGTSGVNGTSGTSGTSGLTQSTYTPTLFNTTNITGSTPVESVYVRIGDWVHVWGLVSIDATAAATISEMDMSLPVASDFNNQWELCGTGAYEDNTSVKIFGVVADDRARWRFTPQTDTNNTYSFHFSYLVLSGV